MRRIFVYGTLLRGESNHHLLMDARFLGAALTEPVFSLFDLGGFPAMSPQGCTSIVGEVYEVSQEVLVAIDRLEGNPNWYTRTAITLVGGMTAETYVMKPNQVEGRPLIHSGNWKQTSSERRGAGVLDDDH